MSIYILDTEITFDIYIVYHIYTIYGIRKNFALSVQIFSTLNFDNKHIILLLRDMLCIAKKGRGLQKYGCPNM